MTKLLDKPLRAFTIYAFVVLLCSIPVYFFMVDFIWIHEVNAHNQIVAESTKKNLRELKLSDAEAEEGIRLWNRLQPETRLVQTDRWRPDSTYNLYRKNKYILEKGYDRFQGLVTCFEMNGKFYSVTVESNVEESYETIAGITAITIAFFIILLFGFIKLNKRISARLWRPFYQTLEKIRVFDLNSQQTIDFEKNGIAEFDEMNTSINKLIASNVSVYRHQKEFIENAAHELQTPLAVVQSKIDLLFQNAEITGQQSELIGEIQNALSRVSRINKNLLLLAKIENHQFADTEELSMSELLHEILSLLSDFTEERSVKLRIADELSLKSNRMLVEIMVTNLLMNAVRHTGPDAKIDIRLEGRTLTVANTGTAALKPEKLFKRFSSASSQTPGSGLGLSIVKEICTRYGWNVEYRYLDERHIFAVTF